MWLSESEDGENRVCLTPESVGLLVDLGHKVLVQVSAGLKSGYFDVDYSEQGAEIIESTEEMMQAQILLKVSPLSSKERNLIRKNQLLITSLQLFNQKREIFCRFYREKSYSYCF